MIVPLAKIFFQAGQTSAQHALPVEIALVGKLQNSEVRLDDVFRRRQHVGDDVFALHDLLVQRTVNRQTSQHEQVHQVRRRQAGDDDRDKNRHLARKLSCFSHMMFSRCTSAGPRYHHAAVAWLSASRIVGFVKIATFFWKFHYSEGIEVDFCLKCEH